MSDYLPFIVAGLTAGSLYGLAGLGLVLTYRTSGIFNFAHGALAAAAAYVFLEFHFVWGWPWPLALLIAVVGFGGAAGVVIERIARKLAGARTATITVATVGILLFIQGAIPQMFGSTRRSFPEFLPTGQALVVSGVQVSWAEVIKVAAGFAAFAGLSLFLRRTRLGVAMRAVVADADLLATSGTNPVRVRVVSWVIGSGVAALTGVLLAPAVGLDIAVLISLVVQAFGAVAVGRFRSLPMTYVGGLGIGVVAALVTKQWASRPPLNGLPAVTPFLVLIVVMLLVGRKLPAGAGRLSGKAVGPPRLPGRVRFVGAAAALALLLAVPQMVGTRLPVYTTGLVFALLFLSLSLLTGVSGQISLGHAAFAGVGAAVFSNLNVEAGVPWLLALLGAGAVTAAVGAVLALPAMRLSGLYLALATFGFGLLMDLVLFQTWLLFSTDPVGVAGRRPGLGSLLEPTSDKAYYYVVLAVVAVCTAVLVLLRRARLGRYLRAMADSTDALRTAGLSVNVTRTLVFTTSAFFAGVAGALYLSQITLISAVSFNSTYSLLYLATFVVASMLPGFVGPAFLAAGALVVVPSYMTSLTLNVQLMLFGAVAVMAAVTSDGQVDWADHRARAAQRLEAALARARRRSGKSPVSARVPSGAEVAGAGR